MHRRPTIQAAGTAGPALPVLTYGGVGSAPVLGPATPASRLVGRWARTSSSIRCRSRRRTAR